MESLPFLVPVLSTLVCVPMLTFACCLGGLRKRVVALEERAGLMEQDRNHSPFSGGIPVAVAPPPIMYSMSRPLPQQPPPFIGGVQYPYPTAPLPQPQPLPPFRGFPQPQQQPQPQRSPRNVV